MVTEYELIGAADVPDHWDIKIINGPFKDTVIRFGALSVDEKDEDQLNFNFEVIEPSVEEAVESNVEMQDTVGSILTSILEESLKHIQEMDSETEIIDLDE